MTLALYGKSRRRQLLLIVGAAAAIFVATILAVSEQSPTVATEETTAWLSPTLDGSSVLNSSVALNGFTNGDRAKTQDDSFAFTPTSLQQHSYGSFGVPDLTGNSILGVEVRLDVWTRTATNTTCEVHVRLWRDGQGGADRWTAPRSVTLPPSTDTDTYVLFGGASDLWDESEWLVTDLTNAALLVDVQYLDPGSGCTSGGASGGIALDHIQIRVHYAPPTPAELPDLSVTKDTIRNGLPVQSIAEDETFLWRWRITNDGEAAAVFDSGETVLRDEVPSGITYGTASNFGNISCGVSSNVFTCTANGTLTIPPATTISVAVNADPNTPGTYTNPAAACHVDYLAGNTNGNVAESDETNNGCPQDVSIEVIEERHPRVCTRLIDDLDGTAGETATFFLAFHNVTTNSSAGAAVMIRTETAQAAPIQAGECSDLGYVPIGTVIQVTATVTSPADTIFAPGYPIALLIPGADPAPPTSVVQFTVGDNNCGIPTNGENPIANNTCNLYMFFQVAPATPPVELPTVRKEPHPEPIADGKARWNIVIDQATENWAEQTVVITDAHDDIEIVGDSPCELDGDELTCTVGEDDVTVTVARAITPANLNSGNLCDGGTIANHLTGATVGDADLEITAGSTPVAINVRDTTECDPAVVLKSLVPDGEQSVSDPADVRWLLSITNPEGGLEGAQIQIRDLDAILVEGSANSDPPGNVDDWCEIGDGATFAASCELPSGSTVTFIVAPTTSPALQCEDSTHPNTAEYRLGDDQSWTAAVGPTITLLGAESECPQDITIVKRLVNVPDGFTIDPGTDLPMLNVPDGTYKSGPTGIGDGTYTWVYTVAPRYEGVVTETVPAGWESVQCEAAVRGAYTTFCNQPLATISVTKLYTPNGGPDATDDDLPLSIALEGHGAFVPAGPTANNQTDYTPKVVSAGEHTVTETLGTGWHLATATVAGAGCTEVVPEDIFEALESTLARAIDALHLETSITLDAEPGSECSVTFTNERLVATVVVEKVYLGAEGDEPELSLTVDGNASTGTWTTSGDPATRWEQLIGVGADGSAVSVTETLPAGWANVRALEGSCDGVDTAGAPTSADSATVDVASLAPGETATVCFVNVAVGQVQLVKLETVSSGGTDSWSFTSTASGINPTLQTADSDTTSNAQASFPLVPAGEYTISETGGRGTCLPGTTANDFETRAAAAVATPPDDEDVATVVGSGNVAFTVEKGQTTYIRFDNVGCGTVLGTGMLVVWKFADLDGDGTRDANEPPVPNWPFTISGPDGTFEVVTDAEGKHVFTVAKGGSYTVTEAPALGWLPIGSVQSAVFTPGTTATVEAGLGQTREVTFLNQPRVNIEVSKTEFSNAAPAGEPGEGWNFSLSGCGISRSGKTGADGTLVFSDLPPASGCSYTVTETQMAGWVAVTPSRTVAPAHAGETATLGFRNIRVEGCADCSAPPSTGTTPVPTQTVAPTGTPNPTSTPTAAPGGATPSPEPSITAVAGDRTPGPASTPIAPDTGAGPGMHGGSGLLLWLLGSAAVASGLLFVRLGRRRN